MGAKQRSLLQQTQSAELLDGSLVGMRDDGLKDVDYLGLDVVVQQVEIWD